MNFMGKDSVNKGKDAILKGMSKIRGPSSREQSKFQFDFKFQTIENVPSGTTGNVFLSWKRGSKSSNNGKTKPLPLVGKSVSFNHFFTMTTTLYKEKPPKKGFEPKTISLSVKEDKGKKASTIGKTLIDLADYTANTKDEQIKNIQIKPKKGSAMLLMISVRTKELEMNPDDEPATETDLNSNDGSDDEEGEDFPDDDMSDISTSTSSISSNPTTTSSSSSVTPSTSASSSSTSSSTSSNLVRAPSSSSLPASPKEKEKEKEKDKKSSSKDDSKKISELEKQITELQKELKNKSSTPSAATPSTSEVDLKKRIRELASENVDLEDKVKELEEKLEQLRQRDSTIQNLNEKNKQLEKEVQQVKSSSPSSTNGKQEEVEELKREIQLLKEVSSPSPMVGGGTLELKRKIQDLTREIKDKDEMINKLKQSGGSSNSSSPVSSPQPQQQNNSTNPTIINLEKQINELKQTNNSQKQEIEKLKAASLATSAMALKSSSSSSNNDESLKREITELKDKLSTNQNDLKRLQERYDSLKDKYADETEDSNFKINQLKQKEEQLNRRVLELQDTNEQLENRMNSQTSAASSLSFGLSGGKDKKDKEREKEREREKQERESLQKQLDQTTSDLSKEKDRNRKLEREIKELKDRIRQLEQQHLENGSSDEYQNSVAKSDYQEREENKIIEQCIYTQSLTFRDGVGACASSLFSQLSDINAFSNENSRLFNKVINGLTQTVEKSMENSSELCYWLSNISGLIHLIKDGPNNIGDSDRDPLIDGVLINPVALSPTTTSRRSPSITFYYQLESLCRETYSLLLHNIYNKLKPKLSSILYEASCIIDKKTSNRLSNTHTNDLQKICKILGKYMNYLKDKFVFDSIIQQFFCQTFHFIGYTLLNDILNGVSEGSCTPSSGFKIKLSLSLIEDWISTNEERETLVKTKDHLGAIIEASNLMVIDKSIFTDSESIVSAFTTLNILHIKKLLEIWKPDHLSPDPIPSSVINMSKSNWNRPSSNLTLIIDPTILIEVQPQL
eukprot:gene8014-9859_t